LLGENKARQKQSDKKNKIFQNKLPSQLLLAFGSNDLNKLQLN